MQAFLFVMSRTASVLLGLTAAAMILRLILSLLSDEDDEENRLLVFLALITEPVAAPMRALLSVFGIGDDSPVDVGYYTALIVILILSAVLPTVTL